MRRYAIFCNGGSVFGVITWVSMRKKSFDNIMVDSIYIIGSSIKINYSNYLLYKEINLTCSHIRIYN